MIKDFLLSNEAILYFDHEALKHLHSQNKVKVIQVKWLESLSSSYYILKYKYSIQNKYIDALNHWHNGIPFNLRSLVSR